MRESTLIQIPQQYKENEKKALCKVCGKPKSEWNKGKKKYCSDECVQEYQKCYTTWEEKRQEILKRDNYKCVICGSTKDLEIDHKIPIKDGGAMWDNENLRTLCKECHKIKTKEDMASSKKKRLTCERCNISYLTLQYNKHNCVGDDSV